MERKTGSRLRHHGECERCAKLVGSSNRMATDTLEDGERRHLSGNMREARSKMLSAKMYTDEYIHELRNRTGNDPALLERVVYQLPPGSFCELFDDDGGGNSFFDKILTDGHAEVRSTVLPEMNSPDSVAAERFPDISFSVIGNHELAILIGEEGIVTGTVFSVH